MTKLLNFVILASVLTVTAHALTYDLNNSDELFKNFAIKYNKTYVSDEERAIKLENFKNNLKMINEKNMASKYAVFDINEYSDLNKNALLRRTTGFRLGLKKNPSAFTMTECSVVVIKDEPQALLPETLDWRDKHGVTPVKNQMECGSCWAFSTIANIESLYNIKYDKALNLSEQHLVNCDNINNGCAGGLMHWALESILQEGGVVSAENEPYYGFDGVCKKSPFELSISGSRRYVLQNENKLRELLVVNGPISVAIDVSDLINYKAGIADICENNEGLNHAVLLVGYGVKNDVPYWILKNSWGAEWGEEGYFRVQRDKNSCGMMNEYASSAIL
ncbi:ORF11 cathepsin [Cydia pomonella granulovirus]|uniref:Viral cathepsin n=1 Tax=Cydia pomonella granulosis virus (isolate Mexico/1963) TaxID=654905 RepID=CATV_GVCPM|nr:ORF11 cathepsin [Cydia pomonella granulovirus]O91466.1 RecName: Full=Viral cathepsin; Short=V-cath; AltName: Full=Cysteine proteinase; Short=CP; Flags: Precursor [Cydia pomonella granulosis virus (isolate Mexican)]AAK70678.1 ORF11 cathepsin [Cydia pomonella granulovirus]